MTNILNKFKNIIFDFDGVIIDSMDTRVNGIREVFSHYDKVLVDKFVHYYTYNAGLSKFIKIKYFYNEILEKDISKEKINEYSRQLTVIMKNKLISDTILIPDTLKFIKSNSIDLHLHIASGSEEKELKYICEKLEIDKYFKTIQGAPLNKNDIVKDIIIKYNYNINETAIIGDSINDYEAGKVNNIHFLGYNNEALKELGTFYIDKFS